METKGIQRCIWICLSVCAVLMPCLAIADHAKDQLPEPFAAAHAAAESSKYEQAGREYEKAFILAGRSEGGKIAFDATAAERINNDLDALEKNLGATAIVLNLRGRILLAQGKNIEAIQTLEKARKLEGESKKQMDGELLFALAQGYFAEHETGSAKKLCEQINRELPTFLPPRVMLVQILLDTNDFVTVEPNLSSWKGCLRKTRLLLSFV
jgi:tetratricopeptide (TPR) repeat protein